MTSKGLLTIALLGFVAVSVATLVFRVQDKGHGHARANSPDHGGEIDCLLPARQGAMRHL